MKTTGLKKIIRNKYEEVSEIAGYLRERGWAEGNAGNISINITDEIKFNENIISKFKTGKLNKSYPYIAGNFFLITSSGSRMRDIAKKPFEFILLLHIPTNVREYRYVSLSKGGIFSLPRFIPTSELFTHLAYHNLLKKTGSKNKAVLHAHVTELIALTHIKAFTNETKLNKLLQSMHPEIKMFIPEGVGLVPLMEPGTEKIADATIKSAVKHRLIIWEKHGCFAAGENLSDAFDLIDIIAKAAKIYFLSKKETN